MNYRPCLTIILTVLMFNPVWAAPLFARSRGGWTTYSPGQLHAALLALGTGQDAVVGGKLRDKTAISGYISQIDATHFSVTDAQNSSAVAVYYEDVKELRGENAANGVRFAARVSLTVNIDVNDLTPPSPGQMRGTPKHSELIGALFAVAFFIIIFALLATDKS